MKKKKCKQKGCKTTMSKGSPDYCPEHNDLNISPDFSKILSLCFNRWQKIGFYSAVKEMSLLFHLAVETEEIKRILENQNEHN